MLPPGPRPLEFLRGVKRSPPLFFLDMMHRHGALVRCPIVGGGRDLYVVNDPDHARYVLSTHHGGFVQQDFISRRMRRTFGRGLVISEGTSWQLQRRRMQPAFQKEGLQSFLPIMERLADDLAERWRSEAKAGRPLEIRSEMQRFTLEVITQTLFSEEAGSSADSILRAIDAGKSYIGLQLPFNPPFWVPLPVVRRFVRARADFDRLVDDMIRRRRASERAKEDLLDVLLASPTLEPALIRDEVKTMIVTGQVTSAASLSWALWLLASHPEHQLRIREEARQAESLGGLTFTSRVIDEVLRVYPPGWSIWRRAIAAERIGGFRVRRGSAVVVCPLTIHRNPDFWERAEVFDPDRKRPARSHWFLPFGLGPRKCIGNGFAVMEMALVLSRLLRRVRLDVMPGQRIGMDGQVVLAPDRPIWVKAS